MFQTVSLWRQIALSVVLNWILGPFVSFPYEAYESVTNDRSC